MSIHRVVVSIMFIIATASAMAWSAELEIVKATWSPDPRTTVDVTKVVAGMLENDRIDWKLDPKTFGSAPVKVRAVSGRLSITYKVGDVTKTETFRQGDQVWISSVSREELATQALVADLRKAQPEGLLIVKARYGRGNDGLDVRDLLQSMIIDDSLTIPVCTEAFGNPNFNGFVRVTYHDGKELKTVDVEDSKTLQIGPKVRPVVARAGGVVDLQTKLDGIRKRQPKGVLVLDARFGRSEWFDVTAKIQGLVIGDSLTVPVSGEALAGRAGHAESLEMYYATGNEVILAKQNDKSVLQIGDKLTAVEGGKGGVIFLPERAAELRKRYPAGLLVLDARYGHHDVTETLQQVVSGDSLTAIGGSDALGVERLGNDPPVIVVYQKGEDFVRVESKSDTTLQIGPRRTAILKRTEPGMLNLDALRERWQQDHPKGLLIVDAKFGRHDRWMDVTERVQDHVKGDTLDFTPTTEEWGSPWPGNSNFLITTYFDGKRYITVETFQNNRLRIDANTLALVDEGGLPLNDEGKVALLRTKYGDGLLILEAIYGYSDNIMDHRELLQKMVKADRIVTKVGEG